MVGFFIKKSFFDGWDNCLSLVLQNLIYVGFLLLNMFLLYKLGENPYFFYSIILFFVLVVSISLGGTAEVGKNYAFYISDTWSSYVKGIKRNIKHSIFFFLVVLLLAFMVLFTIPFYTSFDSILGIIPALILFWVLFFFLLALPYYFPLMTMLPGDGPLKTLRKAFIVSFDNPLISLFLFLHILIDIIISVLTVGLLPGLGGIMLSESVMMKLLMKKYDWLEANPGKTKKDISWDELLKEERDTIGPRSLKSMIFPWK